MTTLTFLELARRVLAEKKEPLTAESIWQIARAEGYDKIVATKGKTPWKTIAAQLYVDIRDNSNSSFLKIDSKPKKFFLKGLASPQDLERIRERERKVVETPSKTAFSERDLHPLLAFYAYTYMNAYTKTIRHQRSAKKSYAQWLHPDLVGVHFPAEGWGNEVRDFGLTLGARFVKLYSFEVKTELTFSNIRESFFQAVSNSSWANEGHLGAARVNPDAEFTSELRRLSASFGIGIIRLDAEDPHASDILFPAKSKDDLDWETINKLAGENSDFREFLARVKNDLASGEVRKEKYEPVYDTEKLRAALTK